MLLYNNKGDNIFRPLKRFGVNETRSIIFLPLEKVIW